MSPLTLVAETSPCAPDMEMLPLTELASTVRFDGTATSRLMLAWFQLWLPRQLSWRSLHELASSYITHTTTPRDVCSTLTLSRSASPLFPRLIPTTSTLPVVDGTTLMSPLTLLSDTSLPA